MCEVANDCGGSVHQETERERERESARTREEAQDLELTALRVVRLLVTRVLFELVGLHDIVRAPVSVFEDTVVAAIVPVDTTKHARVAF